MSLHLPTNLNPLASEINKRVFAEADATAIEIYLVGGYLRDILITQSLPQDPHYDLDYCIVNTSAISFAKSIAAKLSGNFILLDEELDTARVVLTNGTNLDFAGCIGGSIENDVRRRDFSVNALFWSASNPNIIHDTVNGITDIKQRIVRALDEKNFIDDPLRLLRAFRIAASISGTLDPYTQQLIAKHAYLLPTVAYERITYELFKLFEYHNAYPLLKLMGHLGILEAIFPELTATRKVPPNAYHHLNLWDHSLELVNQAELLAPRMSDWVQSSFHQELSNGISRLAVTKIACLLHDLGKPDTWSITDKGRHTFYGHDRLGADLCLEIADRLRWSKTTGGFIYRLVRWHLRPGQLFHDGIPTIRAINRFYRTMDSDIPELMLLAFADLNSTCGDGIEGTKKTALKQSLQELLDGYYTFCNSRQTRMKLLDGNEIMKLFSLEPGPHVGEVLSALEEAQDLGEIISKDEAIRFVRKWLASLG